jgi:pyruvate dehydrogenase E1 component alpha subunit/2-oxoisovalerate dehydrogenase E1 component alpha subunit
MRVNAKRSRRESATEPVSRELLEALYRNMRLTRATEEKLSALYRQGHITGGLYSSLGEEAVSAGTTLALGPEDVVAPMIRNLGTLYARGYTPREIFCQFLARANGHCRGKDNVAHIGDPLGKGVIAPISMLGTLVPVMTGVAMALRWMGRRGVALTYVGDGATSTGDFHEGLNLASVMRAPLVLVIQNNQYAYSTPTSQQYRCKTLADRAVAYGIPGARGDGNDAIEVYRMTREAAEVARRGDGPFLLEFVTFRMRGHAEHDPATYVAVEERERWRRRDPIARHLRRMKQAGFTDAEIAAIDDEIRAAVEDAAEFALASPLPDPATVLDDVFEDNSIVRFTHWADRP